MTKRNSCLIITILVLLIISFFWFFVTKNLQLSAILKAKLTGNKEEYSLLINKPQFNSNKFQEIEKVLDGVYQGKTEFEKTKIPEFTYSTNNEKPEIKILVYKYIPGNTVFQEGYEGFNWTRDLAKDVNEFKKLKPGVQQAHFYLTSMGSDYTERIELRKINSKNYAVVDGYFRPSASFTRYYHTYDEKNSQLIYISLVIPYDASEVVTDNDGKVNYPQEVNIFLQKFESEVLSL